MRLMNNKWFDPINTQFKKKKISLLLPCALIKRQTTHRYSDDATFTKRFPFVGGLLRPRLVVWCHQGLNLALFVDLIREARDCRRRRRSSSSSSTIKQRLGSRVMDGVLVQLPCREMWIELNMFLLLLLLLASFFSLLLSPDKIPPLAAEINNQNRWW